MLALGSALVSVAPLDFLSHRLQMLDCTGGSCAELVDASDAGPIRECQIHFGELANPWSNTERGAHMSALLWHLEGVGLDRQSAFSTVHEICVGLAAAVWSRLEARCPIALFTSAAILERRVGK